VDWTLTANTTNDDADADHGLSPTSGRLIFEVNQTRASVNFSVTQNDIPSEAKAFVFRFAYFAMIFALFDVLWSLTKEFIMQFCFTFYGSLTIY